MWLSIINLKNSFTNDMNNLPYTPTDIYYSIQGSWRCIQSYLASQSLYSATFVYMFSYLVQQQRMKANRWNERWNILHPSSQLAFQQLWNNQHPSVTLCCKWASDWWVKCKFSYTAVTKWLEQINKTVSQIYEANLMDNCVFEINHTIFKSIIIWHLQYLINLINQLGVWKPRR